MNDGVDNRNNNTYESTSHKASSAVCTSAKLDLEPIVVTPKDCDTAVSGGKILSPNDSQTTVASVATENCLISAPCDTISENAYVNEPPTSGSQSSTHVVHTPSQLSVTPTANRATTESSSVGVCNLADMPPNSNLSDAAPFSTTPPQLSSDLMDGQLPAQHGNTTQGEYYVMVHVDAGETFSVRVGDQIQHIPGKPFYHL